MTHILSALKKDANGNVTENGYLKDENGSMIEISVEDVKNLISYAKAQGWIV